MKRSIITVTAFACLALAPQALAARAGAELSTPVVNGDGLVKYFDGTITTSNPEDCALDRPVRLQRKRHGKFKPFAESYGYEEPEGSGNWVYKVTIVEPPAGTYRVRMKKTSDCKPAKSGTVKYPAP